jgi:hypothetical protein
MIVVATLALVVLSLVVLPGRHFLISMALSTVLFLFAHVAPVIVLLAYLVIFVGSYVALFGFAALLFTGRLGPILKLFAGRQR